jgi:Protein of unknown function (DUF1552)
MHRRSHAGLSRRRLIQSLGLGAAAAPLLPLLNASGQSATRAPKRLLLLYSPDGAAASNFSTTVDWRPVGTETDFTFHPMHAPLEPYKAKIVVPWGLTLTAGGAGEAHAFGMAGVWTGATLHDPSAGADFDGGNGHRTGWGSAPSIDQLVAQAFGPNMPYQRGPMDAVQETPYRSLALGVQCGNPTSLSRMTYSGDNAPIHPEINPKAAFDRLFTGVKPSTGGTAAPPVATDPAVARNRAEQQAIVDLVRGDLQRIRTRVGSADYKKIDAHLEGLRAIEARLTPSTVMGTPTLGCSIPIAPPASTGNGGGSANFPAQVTQMMDIAVHALACDLTRVVSLQLSAGFSNIVHSWIGMTKGHHSYSHDGIDERVKLQAIDTWYAGQFAYLLKQLDSVNEGTGTLLDNTLVVYGRELGSTAHRMDRSPLLMAGGAGGALKTGRFLNYDKQDHVKLLVSIAQIMGLPATTIGNRIMNSGPLVGLV